MHLIDQFAAIAETYISDSHRNPVYPASKFIEQLRDFNEPLQENPVSPEAILDLLHEKGSPATVKSSGGRYFGFVTGGSQAKGLFQAPEITVVVSDEVHVSLLKALNLIGFGRERIIRVPVDGQGRMCTEKIPDSKGPTIICLQAGNVNTGAFDPFEEIGRNKKENVWIHVDAAFGLWAAASEKTKHLVKGIEGADSWATDAHKWLNAPYDSGLVFVKDKPALFNALSATAAYLPETGNREPMQYTPEMSREARGVPIWAALKSLGRQGLAKMINSHCEMARYFANAFSNAGYSILNDVVLNQVLVSFGDPATTLEVIKRVQADGTCWCGGTTWQGKTAMRISVSSWATTVEDVDLSINAILKAAEAIRQPLTVDR
jgi:glutamate/tyrosine decarboxylase-like PLP-dependent enzyme